MTDLEQRIEALERALSMLVEHVDKLTKAHNASVELQDRNARLIQEFINYLQSDG